MSRVAEVNGLQLYYRDEGEGEPLLLLHGFTGCGDDWQHVFPSPLPGFRTVAPDLRGHGRSTNPSGAFRFADVARDIFALIDKLGIFRARAIGMSAGANTLLHMATQQPARISAMMLVSTTPRYPDAARAIMRTMTEETRSRNEWDEMRARHHLGDDQIRALWRHVREFAEDTDDMNFTAEKLAAITSRTMIVHGDRDPLYPVEQALELYRAIPGAALWVVPEGGHGPIFGAEAPPFARTAAAFLQDRGGSGVFRRPNL
jgi:pimeloyl-ACP methyl ester carboxylesterase